MQGGKEMIWKKNETFIRIYIIAFLFFILLDWGRFDLIVAIDNMGFNLIFGLLLIGCIALYAMLLISSLVYLIWRWSTSRSKAVIPLALMLTVFLYYFIVNYSSIYMRIDYSFNRNDRQKIIEMYEDNQLTQINVNRYLTPYRLASHNKVVYIQTKENVTKAIFFISNGFEYDRVLLYVSDENVVLNSDFGEGSDYWDLQNIRKVSDNWYFAEISH